jgi:hypothetical protein
MKLTSILIPCAMLLFLATTTIAGEKIEKKASKSKVTHQKFRNPSSTVARPPQFVILAFDGSLNLNFWKESQDFADTILTKDIDGQPRKLKFTYFINPVYYVESQNRSVYSAPGVNKTTSCIGWSSPTGSFVERVRLTNQASYKGHEIASHANSHCDASGQDKSNPMYGFPWGENEWTSEFSQFNNMLFNVFEVNKTKAPAGFAWNFKQNDIVGFRAPLLAYTDGLWPTLEKFNYKYDTSKSDSPTYWPQRMSWGGWNFPLARIKIAGSTRSTLSMDYNWLCYQSGCASKPNLTEDESNRYKNQTLESYKYYFNVNYFGNRAPVNLGHHFSQWNMGAYWNAMKDFAKYACSRSDVRCVTFKEYATWLEQLPKDTYEAYRKGQFDQLPRDSSFKEINKEIPMPQVRLSYGGGSFETIIEQTDQKKVSAFGLKKVLKVNFENMPESEVSTEDLKTYLAAKYSAKKIPKNILIRAALVNQNGYEVSWQTYKINDIEQLGTSKESVIGPLEDAALEPESVDAHNTPD